MLPEGKLICAKNGNYFKWYLSNQQNPVYIPKSDFAFAEKLAYKQFILSRIKDLTQEKKALEAYYNTLGLPQYHTNKLLSNQGFNQLLSNQSTLFSEKISNWLTEDYPRNPNHPENLKHHSISGNILRSKSEALIDMSLFKHHIPYRYEAALVLDGITLYPDFTLKHPVNNKIFYWEHFGIIDDYEYRQKYLKKLNLYISNGIIPSINLITTYETLDYPFTIINAEQIIQQYFL